MSWFDEQIKQRKHSDNDAFFEAFSRMADVVMGKSLSRMLRDERFKTKNAIDEILKYYHIKPRELPESIKETMDQLEYLMRPSGIMWRTVNLEADWYRHAVGGAARHAQGRRQRGRAYALRAVGVRFS